MAKIAPQPDWRTVANPDVLLNIVCQRVAVTDPPALRLPPGVGRRLQLFGVACARMVWDILPTDARSAVAIRERFADGRATEADVRASAPRPAFHSVTFQEQALGALSADAATAARSAAKSLATRAAGRAPAGGNPVAVGWQDAWNNAFAAARAHQAELVRDIFPPPGYAPRIEPGWRTATVVALARQMDASGDFSAVPILADALEDAGCYDGVVLERCRARSGAHSRGNWVVDSVLGRE